ncbi:family 1 glycosylhydrolase [Faecalitalea cylindroides]|uniref:family 1 glycosylhydrolase n=1 Tax=Faecalitalea cylindroides TaxID=39483 RepID=UPI003992967C
MISLLKTLKENHIKPMVILYHWEIPLPLEETGDGLILIQLWLLKSTLHFVSKNIKMK